jgi:hypothetical protein
MVTCSLLPLSEREKIGNPNANEKSTHKLPSNIAIAWPYLHVESISLHLFKFYTLVILFIISMRFVDSLIYYQFFFVKYIKNLKN